jgi:hypothetical protein
MPKYQISVPVHVYFEIEAESQEAINDMVEEDIEDAYFGGGGTKYTTVDMRTANFSEVSIYDEVE